MNILNYRNLNDFLTELYAQRKRADPQFSYEIWAAELGFKSRSMIRMVVTGKIRMTPTFMERIAKKLELNDIQKNYLTLLMNHHNTNVDFLKLTYFDKMIELSSLMEKETEINNYKKFLSSVEVPALHILLAYGDLKASVDELHELTEYPHERIRSCLTLLHEMGLASPRYEEDQQNPPWTANIKNFALNDNLQKKYLDHFHHETMDEARRQISKNNGERKFRSIYLTLEEKNWDDFFQEVEAFIHKAKNKYFTKNISGKALYKVNFQIYPLTKKVSCKRNETHEM